MPEKHPNTVRWGGPGASHEDRTKPQPPEAPGHPPGAVSTNPRVSQVSGGGGERDEKHSHVDSMRSSKSHATDTPSPTSSRDYRENRSRNDRQADVAARQALGEPATFADSGPDGATSLAGAPRGDGTPVRVRLEQDSLAGKVVAGETEQLVRSAIARFGANLSDVQVYLSDESKSGSPGPKTCTIQAMPHRAEMIAVTGTAEEMQAAVMAAAKELVQRLEHAFPNGEGKPGDQG